MDALLQQSQWGKGDDARFKSRQDVSDFLHVMLVHKFFHRARKVPVSEQELKSKKKDKKAGDSSDEKKKEEAKSKDKKDKGTDAEGSVGDIKKDEVRTLFYFFQFIMQKTDFFKIWF